MASFLGIFIPVVTAIVVWYANERSKRIWEQYARKEENYKQLVRSLRGFYVASLDPTLRNAFLEQVNLCWLYCPDEVIQKAYAFLSTVHTSQMVSDEKKELALGELVAAIRRDLLSRRIITETTLRGEDFKHLTAT